MMTGSNRQFLSISSKNKNVIGKSIDRGTKPRAKHTAYRVNVLFFSGHFSLPHQPIHLLIRYRAFR